MDLPLNFRYAFRQMYKKKVFTAAIVLTLGVCIGAVTAVFSIVDATLLRPLPYPQPERLAQLVTRFHSNEGDGLQQNQNGATWEQFSESMMTLDLAVYRESTENLNFSSAGQAGYIRQQRVGAGFFRVFGISPMLGREFTPDEDVPNGPPVAILSYNLWRRAFGADANIVGRAVTIAGVDYRIVGVASEQFESNADIWTPLRPSTTGEGQGLNYVIAGRLRPGVTWTQAEIETASTGQIIIRNVDWGLVSRHGSA